MMQLARPMRWFQQLRWKLSLLYTSVTVALIFIGLGAGEVVGYYTYHSIYQPQALAHAVAENARQLAPYISSSPPNTAALLLWLKNKNEKLKLMDAGSARLRPGSASLSFYSNPLIYMAVTDVEGVVIASQPEEAASSALPFARQLSPSQAMLVTSALQGETRANHLSAAESDGALIAASPVFDDKQRVVGALFARLQAPFDWRAHLLKVATGVIRPVLILVILALIGGIGFGLVTAHSLTTRLEAISKAAGAWGRGDFSAVADDSATDEVGKLAHRLNLMANELQGVLALRQELATLGERNRLARDLHDTVKQQVFALAMQIGAVQAMLNGGSPEVHNRLSEAEKLARQIQYELVTIIKELQPTGQTGKDFRTALRDHVADWSRQSGVAAEVKCDGALVLTPPVEQSFFRIVQEALANIARHSRATDAIVEVTRGANGSVTLSITDNGKGFDPGRANGGMGLWNMRERSEALPGGSFKVESKKGKGVRVTVVCDAEAPSKER
jgi:two-component system, NarL family, sensor histidine kinase LiaS